MHKYDPSHVDRLLRQERIDTIRPEQVLQEAGLTQGNIFADVGCGPGFFTMPAAIIVGSNGHVYAIDTQPEMLEALIKRGLPANVTPVKCSDENLPLKENSTDLALAAYVLHEAANTAVFLREIFRILKAGGRLVIIDWKKQQEEHGPPMAERITEDEAASLLKAAGFTNIAATSLNASHYIITASRIG